ncbi:TetR/AcrR family transcriptional regulator [Radiobacillus kanasensis]|uniref:TetR/AcrR family transcriptional regulator n=1 Tax=Radiobacillus kanasensis TaxID=2844358 RepID=UPI001E3B8372|nr:TetR/AcrR family transcriptional regulator [Radiobacillus kanasensis]UFT99708.1 TetR/AcrR family transcriptional regulator [Radiobacillus kanasensis]
MTNQSLGVKRVKDKRLPIMKAAMHLFSSKGYFSTSVQEIADYCGVSKGSVYKCFNSKEELLLQVFEYNHQNMMARAKSVRLNESLSPEERFVKMIVVELEGLIENKDFFNAISKSLPKNNQVTLFMRNIRRIMVNWHKSILEDIFGEEVQSNIWDITFMFQGILKEYTHLITQEQKTLSIERLAKAVYDAIEAVVERRKQKDAVISYALMGDYEAISNPFSFDEKETVGNFLKQIKEKIETLNLEVAVREELLDSVELLEKEEQQEKPRMFLIKAILTFLSGFTELEPELENLRLVLLHDTYNERG